MSHQFHVKGTAWALCAFGALVGCADEAQEPASHDDASEAQVDGVDTPATATPQALGATSTVVLGTFRGYADPMNGIMRIEAVEPVVRDSGALRTVAQPLWCNARTEANGVAGEGAIRTVEVVTEPGTLGRDEFCFGGTYPEPQFPYIVEGAFCGDVTVRSFFPEVLNEVYAEITTLIPFTGHLPHPDSLNSPRPEGPLAPFNQFGLWYYGDLDGSSASCTGPRCTDAAVGSGTDEARVQWLFSRQDELDFTFEGRIVSRITEVCGNGLDDDCDGVVDNGCGTFLDNAPCATDSDCFSSSCTGGFCDISCPAGYWGPTCANECTGGAVNPCTDNGTCVGGFGGDGSCTCDEGWGGAACDTCGDGWFGANCENACPGGADNACYGNGTCDDGFGGAGSCVCTNPLSHGDDCEFTCDDGARNGGEVGTDCGGPCASSCWNREVQFSAFDVDLRKRFGWNIGGDGDWLIAGAIGEIVEGEDNAGAGYFFRWNGSQYVQTARVTSPVFEQNAQFGFSVSLVGDIAVIAAPFETDRDATDSGAVYVYRRSPSDVWTLEARLTPPIERTDQEFGYDVETDGTRIMVGAHGWLGSSTWPGNNGNNNGAIFVYENVASTWTLSQTLTVDHPGNTARLGRAIGVDGDLIVGGAWSAGYRDVDDALVRRGMAYVWRLNSGSGLYELEATLDPGNLVEADQYGIGVAVDASSEVITVAANGRDDAIRLNHGAMFVWRHDGATWTHQELTEPQDRTLTGWGAETSIDDDRIYTARGGRVYLMDWNGVTWVPAGEYTRPSGVSATGYAGRVHVVDGLRLLVGAQFDSEFTDRGTVFVYGFDGSGNPDFEQAVVPVDVQVGDAFGWVVGMSSDYVVAGASGEDTDAQINSGAAYVFSRAGLVWSGQAKLLPADGGANDQFGSSIAVAGDLVAVGAPRWDTTFAGDTVSDAGAVYMFRYDGTTWNQVARIESPYIADRDHYRRFGSAVTLDGDWLVVSSLYDEQPNNPILPTDPAACRNNGAVDVYRFNPGGSPGAGDTEAWERVTLPDASPACGAQYGFALDIDDTRLVVGAYGWEPSTRGSVFVYDFGGASWSFTARLFNNVDAQNGENLGRSVSVRGDRIIAGAPFFDRRASGSTGALQATNSGRATVFFFDTGLWTLEQSFYPPALEDQARFGESVAIEGDVAVAGAIGVDGFRTVLGVVEPLVDSGVVYVYDRQDGVGWDISVSLAASDSDDFDQFGRSVDIIDNRIAVGAVFEDVAGTEDSGAAYLFE